MDLSFVEKPSLSDVYHHGVKGMKWGVRRKESMRDQPSSKPKRKHDLAKKVAVGALTVGGTAAVIYGLSKNKSSSTVSVKAVSRGVSWLREDQGVRNLKANGLEQKKKAARGLSWMQSNQGIRNLKANGIDPQRFKDNHQLGR